MIKFLFFDDGIMSISLHSFVSAMYRLLEKLQDDVTPCHPADLNTVFQQELGQPLEALFAEFEQKAHAAASLAQAYLPSQPMCAQISAGPMHPSAWE